MHRASPKLYTPARARLSGPSDARITLTRDARCITAASRKGPPRLQSADMRGRLLCYSAVMHRASPSVPRWDQCRCTNIGCGEHLVADKGPASKSSAASEPEY